MAARARPRRSSRLRHGGARAAQPTRARPWRSSWCGGLRTTQWTRDGASRDRAVDSRRRRSRPAAWRFAPTHGEARSRPRRSSCLRRGGARACPRGRLAPAWWRRICLPLRQRSSRWMVEKLTTDLAPTLEENHDDGWWRITTTLDETRKPVSMSFRRCFQPFGNRAQRFHRDEFMQKSDVTL